MASHGQPGSSSRSFWPGTPAAMDAQHIDASAPPRLCPVIWMLAGFPCFRPSVTRAAARVPQQRLRAPAKPSAASPPTYGSLTGLLARSVIQSAFPSGPLNRPSPLFSTARVALPLRLPRKTMCASQVPFFRVRLSRRQHPPAL